MGDSSKTTMKFFVLFALSGAAVASPSTRNDDEAAAAALACTAGTSLGENLATAFSTCFGDNSIATMSKVVKKMKMRKRSADEQCYSFDQNMEWVKDEYADDACVLMTLGWMNENFDFNEDAIMADVASLDPVVTGPLSEGHEDCVAEVMDYIEDHECASTYSEEEQNALLDYAEKIAKYECFLHLFEQGCMDFLEPAAGRAQK